MNLWLRLLLVVLAAWRAPRKHPVAEASVLSFRVMPHDLDVSLHMNNGRYWSLMDLGRLDLMIRCGLAGAVRRHGWMPVVSAGKIRFRRELRLWRAFRLETRILAWSDAWLVIEHRVVTRARDGSEILSAIALVRAGLYDRKEKAFVPVERLFSEIGIAEMASPAMSPEVAAFIAAEDALRKAG
ncbi:thioesterase family protein [Salinarimonas sp.]|uniref:thioesterase family protein n=1 Tax=Salinarimonas sp. TaxID=2766526 RepID=UPI003919392E